MVVELTMDRGKPMAGPYIKAFKAAVGDLVPENWQDFIDLNKPTMMRVEPSSASLLLKALAERAKVIGTAVPPDLAPSLLQRGTASQPAAAAAATAPAEDPDWTTVRNRAAELRGCNNIHEFEAMGRGIVIKNLVDRLEREGKTEILTWLRGEAAKRRQELGGPPVS